MLAPGFVRMRGAVDKPASDIAVVRRVCVLVSKAVRRGAAAGSGRFAPGLGRRGRREWQRPRLQLDVLDQSATSPRKRLRSIRSQT